MKAEHHGRCSPFALAARRGFLALALAAVWQVSHAAGGFPGFMATVTGKSTTVGRASNGTPLATTATGLSPGGGWQSAGNYGVAQGAAGAVNVGGKANAPVNGKNVPVEVTGSVSKTDIAGAIVGCATGGIVGCSLALAPIAAALLLSADTRVSPTVPGGLEAMAPGSCTVAPCYAYKGPYTPSSEPFIRDPASACAVNLGYANTGLTGSSQFVGGGVVTTSTGYSCKATRFGEEYTWALGKQSVPAQSPTWYATTPQEVKDKLYSKAFPVGIVPELEKAGGAAGLPVGNIGVSGPATITSSTSTTTNNIDNSVKTSTTTNNYTYNTNTVTNTGSSTQTTTTNAQGQTTESTTETNNPLQETPAEEPPKETQCDKYPETLGCAELDTVEGTIPKATKEVSYTAESVWGGGSCPADKTWASQTLGQSYTLVPWAKACEWAVGMRAIVLLLAAWAAFWVVMPGNTQVKPQ